MLIPFVIGIWMSVYFQILLPFEIKPYAIIAIVVLIIVLAIISEFVKDYRFRWCFGVLLNVTLLLIGVVITNIRDNDVDVNRDYWLARLTECPAVREKSVRALLEIIDGQGKVMAYFENSDNSMGLKYGDIIVFLEPPLLLEPPKNPEQFDYKSFLSRKGVFRQVYLKDENWVGIDVNRSNVIFEYCYRIRDFLLQKLNGLGVDGDEFAVASAILLGYDENLPAEIRQDYVAAGAMHILCVSGMHVGVVYMLFNYALSFLNDKKQWQRLLRNIILLSLIWFYAALSGLAPSILRATVMLSFTVVGDIINRKGPLLNSLAASAFILLCVEPSDLFNIGFQLSYAAVVGIVVFQKPLYRLLYVNNGLLDKLWEITSVSIAAQFATAPFAIYYFHQFPTYFWLSNLFMTPISTVVIVGGILTLMVFFVPYLNVCVALCVKWSIYVMNFIVSFIEKLPYSIVKGLYINSWQFLCLVFVLLSVMLVIEHRSKVMLFSMLFFGSLFSISQLVLSFGQHNQNLFAVYSVSNATAVDFVCANEHVVFCDTAVFENNSIASPYIDNFLIKHGLFGNGTPILINNDSFDNRYLKKRGNLVSFCGKTIGFYDKMLCFDEKLAYRPHVDYFILYGCKKIDLEKILNAYIIDLLIIDSSVSDFYSESIIRQAEELGQRYYCVNNEGAFVFEK
ncbi:MAG: ComEC/Rec2 family competence protein [Candidatus Limimorpha sp.]